MTFGQFLAAITVLSWILAITAIFARHPYTTPPNHAAAPKGDRQ